VEQNDTLTSDINDNKITCENIECFASTAELLSPKKRSKVENLSTITLGFIKKISTSKVVEEFTRLCILFDSGCSATLINKKCVRHWKKTVDKTLNGLPKQVNLRPIGGVKSNSHSQPFMKTEIFHVMLMWTNLTKSHVIMT
jgi:hypothetical protein